MCRPFAWLNRRHCDDSAFTCEVFVRPFRRSDDINMTVWWSPSFVNIRMCDRNIVIKSPGALLWRYLLEINHGNHQIRITGSITTGENCWYFGVLIWKLALERQTCEQNMGVIPGAWGHLGGRGLLSEWPIKVPGFPSRDGRSAMKVGLTKSGQACSQGHPSFSFFVAKSLLKRLFYTSILCLDKVIVRGHCLWIYGYWDDISVLCNSVKVCTGYPVSVLLTSRTLKIVPYVLWCSHTARHLLWSFS